MEWLFPAWHSVGRCGTRHGGSSPSASGSRSKQPHSLPLSLTRQRVVRVLAQLPRRRARAACEGGLPGVAKCLLERERSGSICTCTRSAAVVFCRHHVARHRRYCASPVGVHGPASADFATFEGDAEFQGLEPPAVLAAGQQFNLTSSLIETARGPAAVAMGMVPIQERLFDWLYGDGTGAYDSGRVFLATFLPPTFVEAAFLNGGLFYHGSTGLLPTFVGDLPWVAAGPATSHKFRLPYLEGCTVAELAAIAETRFEDLDSRARMLGSLIDRAAKLYASGGAAATHAWDSDKTQWELTQRRLQEDLLEDVRASSVGTTAPRLREASLTVHFHSRVPRGGTWTTSIPELEADIDKFRSTSRGVALQHGPFSSSRSSRREGKGARSGCGASVFTTEGVFRDPSVLIFDDPGHSEAERRGIIVGRSGERFRRTIFDDTRTSTVRRRSRNGLPRVSLAMPSRSFSTRM